MTRLTNKRILLGVTGGIAAYKSAELIRRMQDEGADVRVVMTAAAQEFITPLTLQALSGHPVATTLLDAETESVMGHIELARWADLILIAPASADFIARSRLPSPYWLGANTRYRASGEALNAAWKAAYASSARRAEL